MGEIIKEGSKSPPLLLQEQASADLVKGWSQNLERWAKSSGLDNVGLGPKTMRKTWESWLVSSYPERVLEVFLSQGHTQMTALSHYLGLPFTSLDKNEMTEYVSGWEK